MRKKRKEAEKQIAELTADKDNIETMLTGAGYYKNTPEAEIASTSKRLANINSELQVLEESWLELSEKIDNAT